MIRTLCVHHTLCEAICSDDCKNGGTCTIGDKCVCSPGWQGERCEEGNPMQLYDSTT